MQENEPPTLLALARICRRAYPDATTRHSEIASDILAGHIDDESRNVEWDADSATGYVACVYGRDGDEPGDCFVRVGCTPAGVWLVEHGDEVVTEILPTAYWSRAEALSVAYDLALELDEAEAGEDADMMRDRLRAEAAGDPDPSGEWCVYWATVGDDEQVVERYATPDQAEAAAARMGDALRASNPGTHLLCGYGVRRLCSCGMWVEDGWPCPCGDADCEAEVAR